MHDVLIVGGGGMVGQKLVHRLLADNPEVSIRLLDLAFPDTSPAAAVRVPGNVTDGALVRAEVARKPDTIFHLAAIVSGEAEIDFDKGWSVNMLAVWDFLSALREAHDTSGGSYVPRVVFTSSIAVFGAPYEDKITDTFLSAPQTSYGAQKAISDLLINDFSRKGFIDGMSIRLPTICVRPGKPNLAASSFFSGIIREPLAGQEAVLPVDGSVRHWHASPRSAAGFLVHAAGLDTDRLGGRRALNMPGLSCTVDEQIEALREIAGNDAVALIKPAPDPAVEKIVSGWPRDFDPARALALGFQAEASFREIIEIYIEDDLRKA